MVLLLHISVALATILITTLAYLRPSQNKLHVSYGLAGATFLSGVYLTVLNPSHLVSACITGIVYFSAVTAALLAARGKLAGNQ